MTPLCPYANLATPVIKFCEPNLCSYIVQPANAWSNLVYIIVGILILYLARGQRKTLLWWLGPIVILIGLFSFTYHASYTSIGQMFDLGSMFLFATFLLVLNLQRIKPGLKYSTATWLYVLTVILCLAIMYTIRTLKGFNIGILVFGIELAVVLALEAVAWSRTPKYLLNHILTALLIASVAAVIWMFDYTHLWCDANTYHYLNGHTLWHILTGISFIFVYLFYRQFAKVNLATQPSIK
ncbi:MAG: ceramidase domain-containing protein [Patescibacteria group bacterium]